MNEIMKKEITASAIVQEFTRRNIEPDKTALTDIGWLRMWFFCNKIVAELWIGSQGKKRPGMVVLTHENSFVNTCSPEEIADEMKNCLQRD